MQLICILVSALAKTHSSFPCSLNNVTDDCSKKKYFKIKLITSFLQLVIHSITLLLEQNDAPSTLQDAKIPFTHHQN